MGNCPVHDERTVCCPRFGEKIPPHPDSDILFFIYFNMNFGKLGHVNSAEFEKTAKKEQSRGFASIRKSYTAFSERNGPHGFLNDVL